MRRLSSRIDIVHHNKQTPARPCIVKWNWIIFDWFIPLYGCLINMFISLKVEKIKYFYFLHQKNVEVQYLHFVG